MTKLPIYDYNGGMLKVTTNKENKMKTYTIQTRLAGTRQQYFVGRVLNDKGGIVAVHTSKDWNYLVKTLEKKCEN